MHSRHVGSKTDLLVLDTPEAVELGYTSDLFHGDLRRSGKTIYIWRIASRHPGRGDFSRLVQTMLDAGYTVKIPTPIKKMVEFVRHKGFVQNFETDPECEAFEVWVKRPPGRQSSGPVEWAGRMRAG